MPRIMQATIAKYSGMMARFNVDDKGTIMFAAFGPPFQHEDDAARANRSLEQSLNAVQSLVRKLRGATAVLLAKSLASRFVAHLGLRGFGPESLRPLMVHLVGHHHAHLAALESALGTNGQIEGTLEAFVDLLPSEKEAAAT